MTCVLDREPDVFLLRELKASNDICGTANVDRVDRTVAKLARLVNWGERVA